MSKNLTVKEGIQIQRSQLDEWKRKLKSKVYSDLYNFATENNYKAKTGYDIIRGDDLTYYIKSY